MEILKSHGFLYPLFNSEYINKSNIHNHSIPICSMFLEEPDKYHVNIRQNVGDVGKLNADYFSYLKECLSSGEDIILSGEGISILSQKALDDLCEFFESFNYNIIPFALVRSPYEFHCSSIQENVKGGKYVNPEKFFSQINKIIRIKTKLPTANFYPFRKAVSHKFGPVGFLFDLIGVSPENLNLKNTNDGIPNVNVRAQLSLNKHQPLILNSQINQNWQDVTNTYSKFFNEKFLLHEHEFNLISKKLDIESDLIEKELGEEFKDNHIKIVDFESIFSDIANFFLVSNKSDASLLNEDADILREIALKYDNNKKLTIDDAYYLMRLAKRARPNGPVISKKISDYEKLLK